MRKDTADEANHFDVGIGGIIVDDGDDVDVVADAFGR